MSHHSPEIFPRKVLYAFAALIGFSLVLVATARLTGLGISHVPTEPVVEALDIQFVNRDDGALIVRAAADDTIIQVLEPGSNQFIRGVLRATARERRAHQVAADRPFQVARFADGHLSLRDPSTGWSIELRSFGPTNEGAFAAILNARKSASVHSQTTVTAAQTPPSR
ncbi:MAG TPA: photosynthetic complex assembly protein PuhC [Lamprocystis sp. (in: g-proteobacteria)]|nr:photosynthetic complex assembly protein PuhC [Lamprocystis sp. (in: g-proteobacteria)]